MTDRDQTPKPYSPHRELQPSGWSKPIGYANGIEARGRTIFVGGQIGWDERCRFQALDLVGQVEQALKNIVAVLAEAGAGPQHITTMTWYLRDRKAYLSELRNIGAVYREVIGRHFPAMAVVEVSGLIEEAALVEIQATAVLPD